MDCSRPKTHDPDEWVHNAPEFSRHVASTLRESILSWEPDLRESIKWNVLCFSANKLVCGLSACKRHLGITMFRGMELDDPAGLFSGGEGNTAIRTIRVESPDSLDMAALRRMLRAAVELDASDLPPLPPRKRPPIPIPEFLTKALKKERAAAANFEKLSPSCKREYIVWLSSAKRDETRARRLEVTLNALRRGAKWANRADGNN